MAISKHSNKSVGSFQEMNNLMNEQVSTTETTEKETIMPTKAKNDSTATIQSAMEKAETDGMDISKPHPLLLELIERLAPFEENRWEWALAVAGNGGKDPMSMDAFITHSYNDPTNFLMHIAKKQGEANRTGYNKFEAAMLQNQQLKSEVEALTSSNHQLKMEKETAQMQISAMQSTQAFEQRLNAAVDHAVEKTVKAVHDVEAAATAVTAAAAIAPSVSEILHVEATPTKTKEKLVFKVETETVWETAAKAAVTGIVVATAVYGTMRALEYFFGDDTDDTMNNG